MWIAERKERSEVVGEHQPLSNTAASAGRTPGRATEVDEILEPLMGVPRPSEGIECGPLEALDEQL